MFGALLLAGCPATKTDVPDGGLSDGGLTDGGATDGGTVNPPNGLFEVRMRDGVSLKTWMYASAGPAPFPVFLVRNPYAALNREEDLAAYARFFTDRGIAVVWQATRGTGGSGGVFVPYLNEVNDGHDTIAWLVAQPSCNGRIGAGGGSYLGYTAFAAAASHPNVVVILSDDTAADEEMTRHGGAVNGDLLSWWSVVERGRIADSDERTTLTNGLDTLAADQAVLGRDLGYWNDAVGAGPTLFPLTASLAALAPRPTRFTSTRSGWPVRG